MKEAGEVLSAETHNADPKEQPGCTFLYSQTRSGRAALCITRPDEGKGGEVAEEHGRGRGSRGVWGGGESDMRQQSTGTDMLVARMPATSGPG